MSGLGKRMTFQPALDQRKKLLRINRLFNVVKRTLPQRFDLITDVGHARHDDHDRVRAQLVNEAAKLKPAKLPACVCL